MQNSKNQRESQENELLNRIIGARVSSIKTNQEGVITNIDSKRIYVNFECWQSIPLEISKISKYIILDEELSNNINNYVKTFSKKR